MNTMSNIFGKTTNFTTQRKVQYQSTNFLETTNILNNDMNEEKIYSSRTFIKCFVICLRLQLEQLKKICCIPKRSSFIKEKCA